MLLLFCWRHTAALPRNFGSSQREDRSSTGRRLLCNACQVGGTAGARTLIQGGLSDGGASSRLSVLHGASRGDRLKRSKAAMPFHRSLFGRHRDKEWWNAWDYPSRIFDQKFGVALRDEDLFDRDPFARRPLSTLSLSSPRRGQASTISLRMECRLFSNDTIK
ncbi:hypothetical protein MRX96_022223 [Rhipicephalus microplus]